MSSESLIGQTISNYRIISRLGRGGMATVYRARQVTMGRDVAIKVMSAELAEDPQYEARFEREAQVIASLEHPRVLPVHDFGRDGDVFYLVMRLIEGDSLYQQLLQGALPLTQAAKYVNQIAEALDYAHSQGVIHRDLKPNNVLLDELDNVYLMDFGLAKMLAATQSLTQTGTVIGTPQYMAPEQWRGEAVDARTDVYSLGVILYEMVVGRPPFESDTPFTLMYKHVNDPPPSPREHLPGLPEAVEAVILKALAKAPADRYASAGALARALTQAVRDLNVPGAELLIPPPVLLETGAEAPTQAEMIVEPASEELAADAVAEAPAEPELVVPPVSVGPESESPVADAMVESIADDDSSLGDASGEVVPLPDEIVPPPPPIPVPGIYGTPVKGVPASMTPPPHAQPVGTPMPPSRAYKPQASAVRRAFDAVDHSLEMALEKAAQAAPPWSGPGSDPDLQVGELVQTTPQGVPVKTPAHDTMHSLLYPNEELLGVLDVRGTAQWQLWKQLLIGGLGVGLVGALIGSGMLGMLAWMAWIFLGIQVFRTYRGHIGRYYLGFTQNRVLMLPRDVFNEPNYKDARAVAWPHVERLRLTDRYVLLDMPDGDGGTLHLGALLLADGEGGLGAQHEWLPYSPLPRLIADQGFETQQ